jgi:putative ABC transport system permease protein
MSGLLQDVAYAFRTLRRAPGLAATAVLSLGLGIAATTAVFSFVNALQFKSLPFAHPESLVDIEETSTTELCAGCAVGTSYPTLVDWQSRAHSFVSIGAYEETRMVISGAGGDPERVPGCFVSAGLFPTLGMQPVLGRAFGTDDDRAGAEPVALLSETLWRRRFGGDPGVLGKTMKVNGVSHTIVGVMPAGFRFPEFAQFWTPLVPGRHDQKRTDRSLGVIARLKPGVDVGAAGVEMRGIAGGLAAEHRDTNGQWSVRVRSLHQAMTAETVAPSAVLLGAVAFVLLIACANVSNLLLVRASERQREISIRIAIGSSRGRIVRLVLAESLTLGVAGGVLGLTIALWASRAIVAAFGIEPPYWIQFGIDWHVFAFCAAITLGTAILFGLAPALHASNHEPQAMLKEGAGTTSGRRSRRIAGGLVIAQLSLALLLLAGAGLLIKTVVRSVRYDPGFDPSRVLEGDVSLPALRYATPASINAFANGLMDQLSRIPGTRAGVQSFVFFGGFGARSRQITVEGLTSVPEGASPRFYFAVTPGYFRMLGAAVKEGREFGPIDGSDVVIVNDAMAQAIWGSSSALGHRVKFGDKPWRTVIGVVGNINGGVIGGRPNPFAYVPFTSEPGKDLALMISTDRDPASLAGELRAAVRAVDPDQPIEDIMTMAAMFREQAAPSRFVALLMSGLSVVALTLASVGLYGVTAYGVRRRLREIGIRIALGGTAADVVRLILASAWRVIAPGLLLGIGAAWAGTRALQGILFGTSPTDPIVFAATVVTLAIVASLASYLPARRAARVDPIVVLRDS